MNRMIVFLLALFVGLSNTLSHAEPVGIPVTQSFIKVLGGGVAPRHSDGEGIVLACAHYTDDLTSVSCDVVQFISFTLNEVDGTSQGYWVGSRYQMNSPEGTPEFSKEIKHLLKRLNKRIAHFKSGKSSWFIPGVSMGLAGIGMFGGLTWAAAAGVLTTAAMVGFPVGFIVISLVGYSISGQSMASLDFLSATHRAFTSKAALELNNEQGWNWATQSHRVNKKYYHKLHAIVCSGF